MGEFSESSRGLPAKAMILAAGQGTRLKPLTNHIPKCMVPVGGKPVLEHAVEHLKRFGVTELVINLCHLPSVVMNYFGDGSDWGVTISYSVEQKPLGTAGGVRNVAGFFDGPFFVWYGDNLSKCDLARLYKLHRAKGGMVTIALFHREDPTRSGIVGLDGSGRVVRFLEKPRPEEVFSHWVSAGIFVLERQVLDAIPAIGSPDFGRDVFPALLARSAALYGYRMLEGEGLWWIDTVSDLERVRAVFGKDDMR